VNHSTAIRKRGDWLQPKKPGGRAIPIIPTRWWYLVLDVDVVAGNDTHPNISRRLWALLDRIPRDLWPSLLRGDCGLATSRHARSGTARLAYLFKLRLTQCQAHDRTSVTQREWANTGKGWQAKESLLRLEGWSRQRRVIILRRREGRLAISSNETQASKHCLSSMLAQRRRLRIFRSRHIARRGACEFGQLYRDRGDSEKYFDELKTNGAGRLRHAGPCSLPTGRAMIALFYDWWSIFVRLVERTAYGGHHQPATALACHRHAGAACETNNDHRSEFTREGASGREGVSPVAFFCAGWQKMQSS